MIAAHPTIRGFEEPFAERLLPRMYSGSLTARALRRVFRSGAHVIALRMMAIDEGIRAAPELGQFVVLGAGLDTRAWRLPELASVPVFEVDHPATQSYKRRRAASFPERGELHYVSVDFEKESLDERLEASGHRTDVPTVWVWEGVTMYLHPAAVEATLAVVAKRSAPSSRLLVTYLPPSPFRTVVGIGTSLLSEGLRAAYEPSQLATLLAQHGFDVVRDESSTEWHTRWALDGARLLPAFGRTERLTTADRR